MREKTAITSDTGVILRKLSAAAKRINHPDLRGGKTGAVKEAILAACGSAPDGCRLPPLREMSAALGTTIVTIQRAITDLVRDGKLTSRERSGIFYQQAPTRRSNPAQSAPAAGSPAGSFPVTDFVFATDSTADYQRSFWNRIAEEFLDTNVHLRPNILYAAETSDRDGLCDASERHCHDTPDLAPPRDLPLKELLTGAFTPLQKFLLSDAQLVLYYRTYYLFYNPTLLRKAGIPLPAYRDFRGQEEYLRSAQQALEKTGLRTPVSLISPYTLLGADLPGRIRRVLDGQEGALDFAAVAGFCRLFRYDGAYTQPLEEFRDSISPFLLGYSVNFWELISLPPNFPWQAYPLFRCDDTIHLLPMTGTIRIDSWRPLESLRFLEFLHSAQVQNELERQGNLPVAPGASAPAEQLAGCRDLLKMAVSRSKPMFLSHEFDRYLAENVFGGELWQAIIHGIPPEICLRNAISFSRQYGRLRSIIPD